MTRRKRPAAFQPETRSTDGRYIGWMRRNTRSSAGRAASQQMHGQPALLLSWTNLERGTVLDARMQTEDYRDVCNDAHMPTSLSFVTSSGCMATSLLRVAEGFRCAGT